MLGGGGNILLTRDILSAPTVEHNFYLSNFDTLKKVVIAAVAIGVRSKNVTNLKCRYIPTQKIITKIGS